MCDRFSIGMLSPYENDRRQAGRKIIQWQIVTTSVRQMVARSVRQIVLGGRFAKNEGEPIIHGGRRVGAVARRSIFQQVFQLLGFHNPS
jgi:hypothetical protein